MKNMLNTVNAVESKYLRPVLPTAMAHSAPTVAVSHANLLFANLKQAQALAKLMIYSELMLTAIDDLHVHLPMVVRRQKLGNLMRNTRKELEAMIHTFYYSSRVGRMDEATEEQFFNEINQVERLHKLLHRVPDKLLPAVEKVLEDILKTNP